MKTIILLIITLNLAHANVEKHCNLYGATMEQSLLAHVKSQSPQAKWLSKCFNGYLQGVCIAAKGDMTQVDTEYRQIEAIKYCQQLAKR